MITCITPTGDRIEAFQLCKQWMASQTLPADQWIVIDDGFTPLSKELTTGMEYVRRIPKEGEGHTLTENLRMAYPKIKGDKILIIEDDDWYGPNYIKTMDSYLNTYDLVGEGRARYYLVPTMQFHRINNGRHASLCQTGFTKKVIPVFVKCLEGDPYVDARLWASVAEDKKHLFFDLDDRLRLHCSTKGLKGRKGIGSGHDSNSKYYQVDAEIEHLIKWVGEENAEMYMRHVGQSFISAKLLEKGKNKKPTGRMQPTQKPKSLPEEEITVITCTGDRPGSFALLRKWMSNQTIKPKQWIVVDDGKIPLEDRIGFEYIRRTPSDKDYLHTLCLNFPIALDAAKEEKIIIMEDDDWYHPTYIHYMSSLLNKADLVGFNNLVFYFPSTRKYIKKNMAKQPALAQTAFRRKIIPVVQEICKRAPEEYQLCGKGLIDVFLWKDSLELVIKEKCVRLMTSIKTANGRILSPGALFYPPIPESMIKRAEKNQGAEFFFRTVPSKGVSMKITGDKFLSVGMKGLPGRKGLTTHHEVSNRKYMLDQEGELLKTILGKDSRFYLELSP